MRLKGLFKWRRGNWSVPTALTLVLIPKKVANDRRPEMEWWTIRKITKFTSANSRAEIQLGMGKHNCGHLQSEPRGLLHERDKERAAGEHGNHTYTPAGRQRTGRMRPLPKAALVAPLLFDHSLNGMLDVRSHVFKCATSVCLIVLSETASLLEEGRVSGETRLLSGRRLVFRQCIY